VSNTSRRNPLSLPEVTHRAACACHIIARFSTAMPMLAIIWRQVDDALSDIPILTAEIIRLRDDLASSRIDRANLAAAGRATIAAYHSGEPDPFSYLALMIHGDWWLTWGRCCGSRRS
jgi:hypothetical protein